MNGTEQLIESPNDIKFKMKFLTEGKINFQTSSLVKREYSEQYDGTLKIIIQFDSTYLCKASNYLILKIGSTLSHTELCKNWKVFHLIKASTNIYLS